MLTASERQGNLEIALEKAQGYAEIGIGVLETDELSQKDRIRGLEFLGDAYSESFEISVTYKDLLIASDGMLTETGTGLSVLKREIEEAVLGHVPLTDDFDTIRAALPGSPLLRAFVSYHKSRDEYVPTDLPTQS